MSYQNPPPSPHAKRPPGPFAGLPEPHGLPRDEWNAAVQLLLEGFGTWRANDDTLARFFNIGATPMDCVRVVRSAREGGPSCH